MICRALFEEADIRGGSYTPPASMVCRRTLVDVYRATYVVVPESYDPTLPLVEDL